ncbi:MAG TPA: SpoIID/LytB domain-containing protein [Candidatus Limnocylindrales bacterium]|nr:SpoIID/LytB domain-containing protein [Candidatus Limnocylindrales bacterium]
MPVALALAALALLVSVAPVAATDPSAAPDPSAEPAATPVPTLPAGDPATTPLPAPYTAFVDPALPGGAASVPVGLPAAITFHGRGYGHGVGMSQYGARGRALAGQDTPEILAHYFPGTTVGFIDPATIVRVQVLSAYPATATRPLRIYARGGAWAIEGVAAVFPADAQLRVWRVSVTTPTGTRTSAWRTDIVDASGALLHSGTMTRSFRVSPVEPTTTLQLWSKPSTYDRYRGSLLIVARAKPDVINEVGLDDYLRGVVPVEMPASWPAAALRAQAIAARSYAARRIRPAAAFDLYDDTRSQAYRGVLAERPTTDEAVALTAGMVLQYGGAIADTYFHSSAGGATEANDLVWVSSTGRVTGAPVPYLRGGPDRAPDGTAYDAAAGHYAWQSATYTPEQLGAILARDPRTAVGTLLAIDLSRRAPSGRVIAITLAGTAGTRTVSADVFRVVFNRHKPSGHPVLKSTLFAIGTWPTP